VNQDWPEKDYRLAIKAAFDQVERQLQRMRTRLATGGQKG
jgi:ribosome-associated translation inhibitor RaiA